MVLVNRTADARWKQEGVYVAFVADLSRPDTFTEPRKLHDGGSWYCQVIGDAAMRGTDSLAGESARFFMKGKSHHRVVFERPSPAPAEPSGKGTTGDAGAKGRDRLEGAKARE